MRSPGRAPEAPAGGRIITQPAASMDLFASVRTRRAASVWGDGAVDQARGGHRRLPPPHAVTAGRLPPRATGQHPASDPLVAAPTSGDMVSASFHSSRATSLLAASSRAIHSAASTSISSRSAPSGASSTCSSRSTAPPGSPSSNRNGKPCRGCRAASCDTRSRPCHTRSTPCSPTTVSTSPRPAPAARRARRRTRHRQRQTLPGAFLRPGMRSERYPPSAHQTVLSPGERPGRADEPNHQGSDRQTLLLRNP